MGSLWPAFTEMSLMV